MAPENLRLADEVRRVSGFVDADFPGARTTQKPESL
jgi:hypothetical protein